MYQLNHVDNGHHQQHSGPCLCRQGLSHTIDVPNMIVGKTLPGTCERGALGVFETKIISHSIHGYGIFTYIYHKYQPFM